VTTSAASAGSARPALLDHNESLFGRLTGVVLSPRRTFVALAATPRAADVLLVTTLAAFACTAVLLRTNVGELALLDQWERTAIAFGQDIGDAEYAALQEAARNGIPYAAAMTIVSVPVLAALLAGLFSAAFRQADATVRFRQLFAITAHAGVILALRQVIAAPVSYARESLASPASLTVFFTVFDEASPLARFFGVLDLFVIWWLTVLAVGVSVLYRRGALRLAIAFTGIYIALAAVLAGAMAALGGTV
jgi:hypothetical protein